MYIARLIFVRRPAPRLLSNAQRGNGIGGKGLRTKPGFLEPCRAEKNTGSNIQGGYDPMHQNPECEIRRASQSARVSRQCNNLIYYNITSSNIT